MTSKEINSLFDENLSAVLWLSNQPLKNHAKSSLFSDLDYIFDGLLSNHCQFAIDGLDKTLFMTRNFEKNFYLAHLCMGNNSKTSELFSVIGTMNIDTNNGSIALISSESISDNLIKQLHTKYPKIEFRSIATV